MVNDFKSGEVVIADGGRGTTEAMIKRRRPGASGSRRRRASSPGSAASRSPPTRRTSPAAYKLINYYASARGAGDRSARSGFVVMNPKALPLMRPEYRETADPKTLDTAIPETQPPAEELYDRAWQEVAAG